MYIRGFESIFERARGENQATGLRGDSSNEIKNHTTDFFPLKFTRARVFHLLSIDLRGGKKKVKREYCPGNILTSVKLRVRMNFNRRIVPLFPRGDEKKSRCAARLA